MAHMTDKEANVLTRHTDVRASERMMQKYMTPFLVGFFICWVLVG